MWEMTFTSSGAALTFSGRVTGAEIAEAKAAFFAHDFADEARYVICDFAPAGTFEVSSHDVQRIVDQDKAAMVSHPVLLEAVVASTTLQYGLSRMWQQRVDEVRPHTGVFRTRAEAVEWLRSREIRPAWSRRENSTVGISVANA